jgi:hypothetical protein
MLAVTMDILGFTIFIRRGAIMATKKAAGTQVTSDKSMKKTSKRMESTKKKSITKKGEGQYERPRRG